MTVTDTARDSVGAALEQEKVSSHLHPVGSFDVADHAVPTGREEIWRFTPLKRLRGLHADAEFLPTAIDSTWNTPEGVRVAVADGEEARGLRGLSGLVPNTGSPRGCWRRSAPRCSSTSRPSSRSPSRSSWT